MGEVVDITMEIKEAVQGQDEDSVAAIAPVGLPACVITNMRNIE